VSGLFSIIIRLYNSYFSKLSEFMLSMPRVHGHNRLDDDATAWERHQRSTGQTAHTHRSDVFWVNQRQLFCCLLFL